MKTVLKILPALVIMVYMVIAFGFTAGERNRVICNEIQVTIEDSVHMRFYSKDDIKQVITNSGTKLLGYPVTSINTRDMEKIFKDMPFISKANIYVTMQGLLRVNVQQREPVIRVFTGDSRSYYLDVEGYIMPESRRYTPFVIVANGYFPGGEEIVKAGNIANIHDKKRYKAWFDILELVKFINNDDFWRSQIVQIYLNRYGRFEIIPRVGSHQIILGDISSLEGKFSKLRTLYFKGFPVEGWNTYDKIDLRYKNQVVCTKR